MPDQTTFTPRMAAPPERDPTSRAGHRPGTLLFPFSREMMSLQIRQCQHTGHSAPQLWVPLGCPKQNTSISKGPVQHTENSSGPSPGLPDWQLYRGDHCSVRHSGQTGRRPAALSTQTDSFTFCPSPTAILPTSQVPAPFCLVLPQLQAKREIPTLLLPPAGSPPHIPLPAANPASLLRTNSAATPWPGEKNQFCLSHVKGIIPLPQDLFSTNASPFTTVCFHPQMHLAPLRYHPSSHQSPLLRRFMPTLLLH